MPVAVKFLEGQGLSIRVKHGITADIMWLTGIKSILAQSS